MTLFKNLKNAILRSGKDDIASKKKQYEENFTTTELELMKQSSMGLLAILENEEFDLIEEYDWAHFFNALIENIQDVVYVLYLQSLKDKEKGKCYVLSLHPTYVQSKILFFVCDNARLGNIKHYGEIEGRNELQKRYEDYTNLVVLHNDKRVSGMQEEQDFYVIIYGLLEAYDKVKCQVNPREVVEFLYTSPIGINYLPKNLIKYLEDEKAAEASASTSDSETIVQPHEAIESTDAKKAHNRSGSKINPEKHARTKEACQRAWEKVQETRILGLNYGKFKKIATDFLGQGESLVSTVSRAFYKDEVSKEYKKGRGRNSK